MALKTLQDAFLHELKDIYHAEKQIVDALPEMAKNAHHDELRKCFEEHLEETREQVRRIEEAFESIDQKPSTEKCDAMVGLLKEGEELIHEKAEPDVNDALLIGAAQKVEHYEIATYGTLCTWAEILGYRDAANLLKENMSEEKEADQKLMKVAGEINRAAVA